MYIKELETLMVQKVSELEAADSLPERLVQVASNVQPQIIVKGEGITARLVQ